ncbi:LOW QUALITY PROTEIN: hypothetical protein Cgig2_000584 [Carnegiea gigantea]|uniref:Uncharacterized protein n=1 Tax=Carnegiea gigantea TaxID=171969 RepID=A0A9Q1GVN9_9CARY|nr:LOW QUALITY PROTEIN: hypothetical protein Cgig2_000584 [Carnegiea gigantea]
MLKVAIQCHLHFVVRYNLPHHDRQVRSNFEVRRTKQLKNLFACARKSGKAITLQREPTVDELYKDTHMHKTKYNLYVHMQRSTQRYGKTTGPPSPPLMTVPKSLHFLSATFRFKEISLARVTCMALGVVIKRRSHLSVLSCSSSVHNYDACKITMRFNKSVSKAAEEGRHQEFRKQVEEEVRVKPVMELNN